MKTLNIIFDRKTKKFASKNILCGANALRDGEKFAKEGKDIYVDATGQDESKFIALGRAYKYKIMAHTSKEKKLSLEQGYHQIVTYDGKEQEKQSRILIASTNVGKIAIYSTVLDKLGLPYCSLNDISVGITVDETGETELENSRLKAHAYHEETDLPVIANDSGLVIEKFAPDDQPGVFVRRYGGHELTDEETIKIFSEKLKKVGGESDSYFNVALVLCDYDGNYHETVVKSYRYMVATPSKVVNKGLPLRSLDYNKEYGKYMSEMTIEEANASEGKAIEEQQAFIKSVFQNENTKERE